jgi:hypothetical protein
VSDVEQEEPGAAFHVAGLFLILGGIAALLYAAFGYETTVDTGMLDAGRVSNVGLMQNQALMFVGGCVASLAGLICICTSALLRRR